MPAKPVPACEIVLDGAPIDARLMAQLLDVQVRNSLLFPDSAVVRLRDPDGVIINDQRFAIGKTVEVKFAKTEGTTLTSAFKGEIVAIEPPRLLVHTHWSDVSGLPDSPEHYQEVAWDLTDRGGSTELTITERNLPSADAARTSEQGWKGALESLKQMLER